ncbi:hypothetical protein [Kitasatospora sp. NPDC006786]|uniref:hypothetical protein n=1 Tax=unclassified Kitasatospora TaxID=2633591 RepID=UPI0033E26C2C
MAEFDRHAAVASAASGLAADASEDVLEGGGPQVRECQVEDGVGDAHVGPDFHRLKRAVRRRFIQCWWGGCRKCSPQCL